jgi:hypothetical protein
MGLHKNGVQLHVELLPRSHVAERAQHKAVLTNYIKRQNLLQERMILLPIKSAPPLQILQSAQGRFTNMDNS